MTCLNKLLEQVCCALVSREFGRINVSNTHNLFRIASENAQVISEFSDICGIHFAFRVRNIDGLFDRFHGYASGSAILREETRHLLRIPIDEINGCQI